MARPSRCPAEFRREAVHRHHERPHRGPHPSRETNQALGLAGSATSPTDIAGYGSTAPGNTGHQQRHRDHCPLNVEEPEYIAEVK
jgi:hypothetical protein